MQFNENWLREWVDPGLNSVDLAEQLTLAGLEVETLEPVTPLDLSQSNRRRLLVGCIQTVAPHPDADRLKLCQLQIGGKRLLNVVCGAANTSVGLVVPVARAGAYLPDGNKVEKTVIRGVESEGMLCSAMELGMADQSTGLMELDRDACPGMLLSDHLALDDHVLKLGLTPNRGDCLSIRGIAREVAVMPGSRRLDRVYTPPRTRLSEGLAIHLNAPAHCARFAGRIVRDINMYARTPDWMREKLRRAGLRSLNPIVDITNLVMLETGQPMHAYDLDKLSGGIVVRLARKGESLTLLDGTMIRLQADDLVIADYERVVGLAGIMGGDSTAISDTTSNIFLEAAFFSPQYLLGKARRLGMNTDASHRFERGVDPMGQREALAMATRLVLEISEGKIGKPCHAVSPKHLPRRTSIRLDQEAVSRTLGTSVPASRIQRILKRLGMRVSPVQTGWKVTPPSWRFDITGQHDLVEEVGRCHGLEQIPPRMPLSMASQGVSQETTVSLSRIRKVLMARGFHEAINYSFVDPKVQHDLLESDRGIRLSNPLTETMSEMRISLLPGLLANLHRVLNRQESRVRLFETGNVFERQDHKRRECLKIAALATGTAMPRHWDEYPRVVDFFDLKGDLLALLELTGNVQQFVFDVADHPLLHPGQSARVSLGDHPVGYIGKLNPLKQKILNIEQSTVVFELDLLVLAATRVPKFRPLSRFPAVQRDLAVVVDRGVVLAEMLPLIRKVAGHNLKSLELFDHYIGERVEKNKKNLAFSLVFQSESRNLTSCEIDTIILEIVKVLKQGVSAELRT